MGFRQRPGNLYGCQEIVPMYYSFVTQCDANCLATSGNMAGEAGLMVKH